MAAILSPGPSTTPPAVNDWRAAVVDALGKYTADGGSWDDVKTAFVEGWATQYNNDIANG